MFYWFNFAEETLIFDTVFRLISIFHQEGLLYFYPIIIHFFYHEIFWIKNVIPQTSKYKYRKIDRNFKRQYNYSSTHASCHKEMRSPRQIPN